ncbi:MAG: hypothetical protein ACPGYK_00175 [Flavobacteriales bacterium]
MIISRFVSLLLCTLSFGSVWATATGLEVEVVATSEFGTTYHVFATFDSPDDQLIAVYGTVGAEANLPLLMSSSTSFYQSESGGDYGQSINPILFPLIPDVQYDSWLTIGSEDSSGAGGVNAVGMDTFLATWNNGGDLYINTFTGGSWFIVPGQSADAYAGDNGRVLMAQLTTTGLVELIINYQWDDVTGETFQAEGLELSFPNVVLGCMDASACNYDPTAEQDDQSCAYPGDACDDGLDTTMDDAFETDCSCTGVLIVEGCTDESACNYEANANLNVGCAYPGDGCDDGDADTVSDTYNSDCSCSGLFYNPGCIDDLACNYDPTATEDDGSCEYPPLYYDCQGNCSNDVNENDICDEEENFGCTSPSADNYDPNANSDNGTCVWGGGWVNGLVAEVVAEDSIPGMITYRLYVEFDSDDVQMTALWGTDSHPLHLIPSTTFYQDEAGSWTSSEINPVLFAVIPSMEFDSWLTIGAAPGETNTAGEVGMSEFTPEFEAGGALNVNTFTGGSLFVLPNTSPQSVPVNGRVLIAQLTTDGAVNANVNIQFRDPSDNSIEVTDLPLIFPQEAATGAGCTDPEADNFDPTALLDDGSCSYPEPSYEGLTYELFAENQPEEGLMTYRVYANFGNLDDQLTAIFAQEGLPLSITSTSGFYQNENGGAFADQINTTLFEFIPELAYDSWFTIGGDDSSVNLNNIGTDAAAAEFEAGGSFSIDNELGGSWFVLPDLEPLAFPDADGRVLIAQLTTMGQISMTINLQYRAENGENPQVLDETIVFPQIDFGCMDAGACNFDPDAEQDDGTCIYPETYYDCNFNCINDADGDNVCDELEIPGCTETGAANYNPDATDDDGSCEYPGCTDVDACNYDSTANVNDGTCEYPELYYNCSGECINDADGDGICDELEIPGCTEEGAANYNPNATENDGSCEYPGCTNPDADNYDPDSNVDDGSCVLGGCTYSNASNYDSSATYEDGSCTFLGCTDSDAANFESFATEDDGSCVFEILGCTYVDAENYDPMATVDDGSCILPEGENDCPFDSDGNGSVGSADLLDFLAQYGSPCE